MKTDHQFYKLFKADPDTLKKLLDIESKAPYQFRSEALKDLSRVVDGCFEAPDDVTYIVEFYGYREVEAYDKAIQSLCTYRLQNGLRPAESIIVFLEPSLDPKQEPWFSFGASSLSGLRVLYLVNILAELAKEDPNHPLLLVFQPYLIQDDEELKQKAPEIHRKLLEADLAKPIKSVSLEVFESWLMIRFKSQTKKELFAMLAILGDLEESVAYQEIKEEGRREGHEEGKADYLLGLLARRFGAVPDWVKKKIATAQSHDLDHWGDNLFRAQTLEQVFE